MHEQLSDITLPKASEGTSSEMPHVKFGPFEELPLDLIEELDRHPEWGVLEVLKPGRSDESLFYIIEKSPPGSGLSQRVQTPQHRVAEVTGAIALTEDREHEAGPITQTPAISAGKEPCPANDYDAKPYEDSLGQKFDGVA